MLTSIEKKDYESIWKKVGISKFIGKTFLITGATGFIGRSLARCLLYMNDIYPEVSVNLLLICRNLEKAKSIYEGIFDRKDCRILQQDMHSPIDVDFRTDYIIHCAGISGSQGHRDYPADTLTVNSIGTYYLLEYARKTKSKKLLFISSASVYGSTDIEMEERFAEDSLGSFDPMNLGNVYGEAKRFGESLCKAYWNQHHIATNAVRLGHTYGPCIDLDDGHVYSDFIKAILEGGPLYIKSTGKEVRPFCYISDCITGLFQVLFAGKSGESYNLINDRSYVSVNQLAEMIVQEIFPERKLEIYRLFDPVEAKRWKIFETSKIKKIGFRPEVGIREGFARSVASLEEKTNWGGF